MKVTKEIISRLQEGNMLAFQSVYESYSAHIYNFIYSLLYNRLEAEDLTQEVFVRIWEKRDSLDIDKNFDSYIFTIARNLVYDEWDSLFHAELYMKSLEADWDERDTSKVEEDITVNSIGQYIDSLIDKLPVYSKEHLSTKEIAQRLSISERTVEAQIYRSLQFLRKYLAEEGILLWLLSFVVNEY